jgi:hypothetical protein
LSTDPNILLCNPPSKFLPFLIKTLMLRSPSLTLDLLSFLNKEQLKDFLVRFEGQTVTFPSWESVSSSIEDAYLMWMVKDHEDGISLKSVKDLEKEFGLPYSALKNRADSLEQLCYGTRCRNS